LIAGAIAGAVRLGVFERHRADLEAWVGQDLHFRFRLLAWAVTALMSLPSFGMALYLLRCDDPQRRWMNRLVAATLVAAGVLLPAVVARGAAPAGCPTASGISPGHRLPR
jgi:hypothetical protein